MVFQKVIGFIVHFINGVYSSIPVCCTYYFSKEHFKDPSASIGTDTNIKRGLRKYQFSDIGYVRCDQCYKINYKVVAKSNGVLLRPAMKWLAKPRNKVVRQSLKDS